MLKTSFALRASSHPAFWERSFYLKTPLLRGSICLRDGTPTLRSVEEGCLIDNGTHSVDLMRYFIGPLAEVQVVEGKRVQGLAVEDTVRIFVRSISGIMGTIDLSWSINKELDSYINIYGSQGTVFVGWKESKYRQSSSRDWIVFGNGYDKIQAFRNQIKNFCKSIVGEETLLINAEDALASVEVIEASYAALRRNRWLTVRGKLGNEKKPYGVKAFAGDAS